MSIHTCTHYVCTNTQGHHMNLCHYIHCYVWAHTNVHLHIGIVWTRTHPYLSKLGPRPLLSRVFLPSLYSSPASIWVWLLLNLIGIMNKLDWYLAMVAKICKNLWQHNIMAAVEIRWAELFLEGASCEKLLHSQYIENMQQCRNTGMSTARSTVNGCIVFYM